MRLRDARPTDAAALASFDVGDEASPWLDEVREIVNGSWNVLGRYGPATGAVSR